MKALRLPTVLVEDGVIEQRINRITVALDDCFGLRNVALVHVLCRLPETDYQSVKAGGVWFLIPLDDHDGHVVGWHGRVPDGKRVVIYLSPRLEALKREDCILLAAHEISHFLLGHTDKSSEPSVEEEAWDKVCSMGFGTQDQIKDLRSRCQRQ